MDALERQGRNGVVVDVLAEVEFVALWGVGLAEFSLDGDFQWLEAAVAGDRKRAAYGALYVYRDAVTYNVAGDAEGCAEDIRVAEAFKELLADRAVKFRDGTTQSMQIDYKGLQR